MTSLLRGVAAVVSPVVRAAWVARVALRPARRQLLASVAATLSGALALTRPWSWWRHGLELIARPGWWWVPVLLLAAGLTGLARLTARGWSRGGSDRRRPVAVRAPLFLHVGVLLLIAVAVAAAVGIGMWWVFGRPHLSVPGTATPPSTGPGGTAGWSVQNTFDAMKIVLSVVAGIGGVVALTVGYRKQGHSEAAEHREDTKLFNDRFGKAADELGSDKAAVRLAGVYAMAGLADDWAEGRQTCIDVLCAYLRMPYTPPPAPADTLPSATTMPTELPLRDEVRPDDGYARQEQQVRHTVLALIRDHLLPSRKDGRLRWQGHRFNLNGSVFDGGNLRGINVTAGTFLDLRDANFLGSTVDFTYAKFSGGMVNFGGVKFSGGMVNFGGTEFSGGTVNFTYAEFSGGTVNFTSAKFSGGTVDFDSAEFSDGTVNFDSTEISDGTVSFSYANFSGGTVNFDGTEFSGGTVNFTYANFSGGTVTFDDTEFSSGKVNFDSTRFSGGKVTFDSAEFSGGMVNFYNAEFSGGTVNFTGAEFSGGTVALSNASIWTMPPVGIDGSKRRVSWPSSERLASIAEQRSRDIAGS